ncbi:MAG: hypothetical protein JOZ69_15360 [Myxococcales bacterium]|nr:hypothetical protein [Myxococcales bacterium]
MQDAFVPLIASAGAFLVVLVWRVRPGSPWRTRRQASREALRQIQERVERAPDGAARAEALCDAADLLASQVGRRGSVSALYLRAVRADPRSVRVIERAIAALARRPRALESLLWRHLAIASWSESKDATRASLEALRALYEGPLRSWVRSRAMANARDALDQRPGSL